MENNNNNNEILRDRDYPGPLCDPNPFAEADSQDAIQSGGPKNVEIATAADNDDDDEGDGLEREKDQTPFQRPAQADEAEDWKLNMAVHRGLCDCCSGCN